jgi:hypothetical protein
MNRWQPKDPIKHARRKAVAQRRIGRNANCACGESRPEALIRGTKPMRCAECQRRRAGLPTTDDHHVASKNNNPLTVTVPVNDHRELSVMQMDWSKTMRENPSGCPIMAGAAMLRGAVDIILHLIERGFDWVIAMMQAVSAYLRERWGDHWWVGTPIEAFAAKT